MKLVRKGGDRLDIDRWLVIVVGLANVLKVLTSAIKDITSIIKDIQDIKKPKQKQVKGKQKRRPLSHKSKRRK